MVNLNPGMFQGGQAFGEYAASNPISRRGGTTCGSLKQQAALAAGGIGEKREEKEDEKGKVCARRRRRRAMKRTRPQGSGCRNWRADWRGRKRPPDPTEGVNRVISEDFEDFGALFGRRPVLHPRDF